jgi:VWFA-related protein
MPNKPGHPFALILLLAVATATTANSQGPPAPPQQAPVIRTTTRLVVLHVVVTDRSDNPVTDLSRDDFTIFENNEPQNISSFEFPAATAASLPASSTSAGSTAQGQSAPGPSSRTILVFDQLNTSSVDLMVALEKIRSYLDSQPARLAQPTALFSLNKRRLELLVPATQDRDTLLAAVRKNIIELPPVTLEGGGVQGGAERLLASVLALDEITLSSADQKIRKNVIWVSNGIPTLSMNAVTLVDKQRYQSWLHYTVNWLEETQTTVYTLDPHGIAAASESIGQNYGNVIFAGPGLTPSELVFESLATQTGGRIMRNRNDLDVAIASAVREGSSAYTLAYYPSDSDWDSSFRPIRVQISRQGLTARTQLGYYAIPEGFENGADQIEFGLARAVSSPVPFRSIEFFAKGRFDSTYKRPPQPANSRSFRTAPKPVSSRPLRAARLDIVIERDSLFWTPLPNGDQLAEFALVTSSVSSSGQILGNQIHRLEFTLKKDLFALVPPEPVRLFVYSDVPPKTDHLRLVVRDSSSGHLGTFDLPASALTH